MSIQIAPLGDRRPMRLFLVRQIVVPEGDRLEPNWAAGRNVCAGNLALLGD